MVYPSNVNPCPKIVWEGFNPWVNSQFCLGRPLEENYLTKTDVRAATVDEKNPNKFMSNVNIASSSSSPPMASDSVNINQNGEILAWDNYNNVKLKAHDLITRGVQGCVVKNEVFNNQYTNNIYNPQPLMDGGIMPQPTIPELFSFQMVESTAVPMVEGGYMECLSGVSGPTFVNQPTPPDGYEANRGYVDNRLSQTLPMPMNDVSGTHAKAVVVAAEKKLMEKTMERRQKRMIKNRESAARSRARKQAHTIQLEHRVAELTKLNERLLKENRTDIAQTMSELEIMRIQPNPGPCPNCRQHRRTSSAQF